MRTRVCITIDTEFSIGGAFADASRIPVAEPNVWCNVNGRSEGLGFMLDTFRRHRVEATFFVETVQRYYFKNDPMRPIVHQIRDAGHEVQLHSHPCWSLFEQQHDPNLFKALAAVDIPYSSNVAVAVFHTGQPDYALYSGTHERHGVLECPVLTYSDWTLGSKRHLKALTIAGTSFAEMRVLLDKAHAAEVPLVVILTHPFEYVQSSDAQYSHTRRHAVTQQRLTQLCAWLEQNDDRFDACGMARAARDPACRDERNLLLDSPIWRSLPRMGTQVAYDRFGRFALACTRPAAA